MATQLKVFAHSAQRAPALLRDGAVVSSRRARQRFSTLVDGETVVQANEHTSTHTHTNARERKYATHHCDIPPNFSASASTYIILYRRRNIRRWRGARCASAVSCRFDAARSGEHAATAANGRIIEYRTAEVYRVVPTRRPRYRPCKAAT